MDGALPVEGVGPYGNGGVSRRRLLGAGLAAAAATVAAVEGGRVDRILTGAGVSAVPDFGGLSGLRRSDYAPHVGRRVVLAAAGGTAVPATLVAIRDSSVPSQAGSENVFILAFRTEPGTRPMPQSIMEVRLAGGIRRHLLVTPSSPGNDYSAVVNRATPPQQRGSTDG